MSRVSGGATVRHRLPAPAGYGWSPVTLRPRNRCTPAPLLGRTGHPAPPKLILASRVPTAHRPLSVSCISKDQREHVDGSHDALNVDLRLVSRWLAMDAFGDRFDGSATGVRDR